MKTTCLINNYNYAQYVAQSVDAALSQTEPFDEIIVVDDGSTDGSFELLESRYKRHPQVELIGKSNEGQLSCFNEGFARSSGDIVFFLDADDVFEANYAEQALRAFDRDPRCDFLFCGRRFFGEQEGLWLPYPEDQDFGYSVIRTAHVHEWLGGPTSCLSIRTQILKKILPLPFVDDWRVRADDCLVFGASLAGARKRYLAQPLVRYRVHGDNSLHNSRPDRGEIFRRRLALNSLFTYLERKLSHDFRELAEHSHREYRTVERPLLRQLINYSSIALRGQAPLIRRLSCVGDMMLYYLAANARRLWPRDVSAASDNVEGIIPIAAAMADPAVEPTRLDCNHSSRRAA